MDLVTSYNSDENKKTPTKSAVPPKQYDVIDLSDSDSNNEDLNSSIECLTTLTKAVDNNQPSCSTNNNSPLTNKPPSSSTNTVDGAQSSRSKENKSVPVKEIECIDIDDISDSDEEAVKLNQNDNSVEIELDVVSESSSNKKDSKKVDYLHLESSDEEVEQQAVQESVSNLLNSAAILTDIPCGPDKPSTKSDSPTGAVPNVVQRLDSESRVSSSPLLKSFDISSQSDGRITTPDLSHVDKPTTSVEGPANKRFKRESETPKSSTSATNADLAENEECCPPSSSMYRKDERIAGAFAKNIACRLPRQITRHYIGHSNVVTALNWCIPQYSHLLLSASADCTVKIWDMYCKHPVQCIKDSLGLKAAKWSITGEQIVTGGYGKKAHVYDVLSGKEIISYDIFHYVNSIEIHPYMEDIFLCGTRNAIFGFDLRVNTSLPIRTFLSKCEEVLDISFLDENEFVCSTSVVSHDSADKTIMVWDFSTGAIMSNQIFLERYTCPSIKVHPHDSCFIAQTNGDYIAAFSTQKPYKIKDKRYMGHKVSGFGVECDISPDGKYIASGDANGDIYFYSYANTSVINRLTVRPNVATNRLKWHPALNSTLATATWDGHVQIWK